MPGVRLFVLLMLAGAADAQAGYRNVEPGIVVATKDCQGSTGIASFRAERVYTIQDGHCVDPDAAGRKLQQVLLRSIGGFGKYDVIWVDEAGARLIFDQLKENREAALRRRNYY
jgi:hypothetical protein